MVPPCDDLNVQKCSHQRLELGVVTALAATELHFC